MVQSTTVQHVHGGGTDKLGERGGSHSRSLGRSMSSTPRRWVLLPVIFAALLGTACAAGISGQPRPAEQRPTTKRLPPPGESNPDPSVAIPGVIRVEYKGGLHVELGRRVAYDKSPPFGGAHDFVWADCAGTV